MLTIKKAVLQVQLGAIQHMYLYIYIYNNTNYRMINTFLHYEFSEDNGKVGRSILELPIRVAMREMFASRMLPSCHMDSCSRVTVVL